MTTLEIQQFYVYFTYFCRAQLMCIPDIWEYSQMSGIGNPFDVEDLNF